MRLPGAVAFTAVLAALLVARGAEEPKPALDVRTFGAKGDGVSDDTAALQRALNSGEPLFFPAGTYLAQNLAVSRKGMVSLLGPEATLKLKDHDGSGAVTNSVTALACRFYPTYSLKPGGEVVIAPGRKKHGVAFMQEFEVRGHPLPQCDGRKFQCDYPPGENALTYFVAVLKGWAVATTPGGVSTIEELSVTNGQYVIMTSKPHGLQAGGEFQVAGFGRPVVLSALANIGRLGIATAPGHGFREGQAVRLVSEDISGPRWGGWFDGLFIVTNATSDHFEFWMDADPSRVPDGVVVAKPCRELPVREWRLVSSNALEVVTTELHALGVGTPVRVEASGSPALSGAYRLTQVTSNAFRLGLAAPFSGQAAGPLHVSVETAPASDELNGPHRVDHILDERRVAFGQAMMPTGITFVRWAPANLLTITDCKHVRLEMGTIDGNFAKSRSGRYALPLVHVVVGGAGKTDSVVVRKTRFLESAGRCGHLTVAAAVVNGVLAQAGAGSITVEDCEFRAWGNGGAVMIYGPHGPVTLRNLRFNNDGVAGWSEPLAESFGSGAIGLNGGDFRSKQGLGPVLIENAVCEHAAGFCGGGYWFKGLTMRDCAVRGWPTKSDGYHGALVGACKWDDWGEGRPITLERCSFTEPATNGLALALNFAQSYYTNRQGPVRLVDVQAEGDLRTEYSPGVPRIDLFVKNSRFWSRGDCSFGVGGDCELEVEDSSFDRLRIDARSLAVFERCQFKDCPVMIWGRGERGLVFSDCTFEQSQPASDTFLWYVAGDKGARPVVLVGNRRVGANPVRLRVGTGSPDLISLTAISNVLDLPAPGDNLLALGVRALWRGNSFPDRSSSGAPASASDADPEGEIVRGAGASAALDKWPSPESQLARQSAEGVATVRLAAGGAIRSGAGIQTMSGEDVTGPADVILVRSGSAWREIVSVPARLDLPGALPVPTTK